MGWVRAQPSWDVVLSPRDVEMSGSLSNELGCRLAEDNVQVVDQSDIVRLCTRPGDLLR